MQQVLYETLGPGMDGSLNHKKVNDIPRLNTSRKFEGKIKWENHFSSHPHTINEKKKAIFASISFSIVEK